MTPTYLLSPGSLQTLISEAPEADVSCPLGRPLLMVHVVTMGLAATSPTAWRRNLKCQNYIYIFQNTNFFQVKTQLESWSHILFFSLVFRCGVDNAHACLVLIYILRFNEYDHKQRLLSEFSWLEPTVFRFILVKLKRMGMMDVSLNRQVPVQVKDLFPDLGTLACLNRRE